MKNYVVKFKAGESVNAYCVSAPDVITAAQRAISELTQMEEYVDCEITIIEICEVLKAEPKPEAEIQMEKEETSDEKPSGKAPRKKDMRFPTLESLKTVQVLLDEVGEALKDHSRIIRNSPIAEILTGAAGAAAGGSASFAALFLGGSVAGLSAAGITSALAAAGALIGGGMAVGIAVMAAPAVILGGLGVAIASHFRHKWSADLQKQKLHCYKEAIKLRDKLQELMEKQDMSEERIKYLESLLILLQAAIRDLGYDLGYEN